MTDAERCKVFVEDIKAYWDYTLITKYGWVLLIKDDYLRASIGEAILKGVDDKIIIRLTKLYVLIEGHDDLINLFTENQNFALEVIEHLLQKGFSFTVGSMLTDSRRVKDLYYVYSMAKYLDLELTKKYVSIEYLPPTVLFYTCVNAVKIEQAQETDILKPGTVIKIITDVNGYTEYSYAIFNSYSRPFFNVRVGNNNIQLTQYGIREIIVPLDPSSMNFF
jgi:hypothetical protein